MRRLIVCAACLDLALGAWAQNDVSSEERKLATMQYDFDTGNPGVVFTRDGRQVCYAILEVHRTNGVTTRYRKFVLGDRTSYYELGASGPVFSPDGEKVAYAGRDPRGNGEEFLVVGMGDDEASKPYELVMNVVFSPDGGRIAFRGVRGEQNFLVVGEAEKGPFEGVGPAEFSPDGKRLAYSVTDKDGTQRYVIDDVKQKAFAEVTGLVFSKDSSSFAYWAGRAGECLIVHGDREGPKYTTVSRPVLSADGKTLAYRATSDGKSRVIVGDKKGLDFDEVWTPALSADGKHVAYVAKSGAKWCVVVDGVPGREFDEPPSTPEPVFSPDGKRVAYGAVLGQGRQSGQGIEAVFVDGNRVPAMFSHVSQIAFTPSGQHVVYVAERDGKEHLVIDRERGDPFDSVYRYVISPDGKRVAFGARVGKELWWKIRKIAD